MELVINTALLPASTTRAVVLHTGPTAESTLLAVYRYEHRGRFRERESDVIGTIGYDPNDSRSSDRLMRMDNLLHARFGWQHIRRENVKTDVLRERRKLSDLERFRRKMNKVLGIHANNKRLIDEGVGGLFQEERRRELEAELDLAWAKMEERYGCKRADLDNTDMAHRAGVLRAVGKLNERDHFEESLS